ncbi:MAG TPA: Ig-like domain-containing protein, partial [Verrucomicrobiae bacterium]|nr:Ig-like domain-containing protein [Verrucomicrobiae bacterium]
PYSWNGTASGAGNSLAVTIPAGGGGYNANFTDNFRVIITPSVSSQYCPGVSVTTSPAPPAGNNGTDGTLDAFFPFGEPTTNLIATGDSSVNFVGWSQDLGGSTTPYAYSLSNQLIATANFNVGSTTAPLAVTGVLWTGSPASTNSATTLTVTGTGFTTNGNTYAYYGVGGGNFDYRPVTVQSSTQLTTQLNAGDLSTVGYNQILVLNTGGSGCNPETVFTFGVSDPSGAPALSITKMHNGVFGPGEQNAQYTILVTNSGTATITQPVTVTDTLPSGESLVSMNSTNGSGWNCSPGSCTNSNSLAAGQSYAAITVTVNVASNATSPQVNTAMVSGGGAQSATVTDSTTIVSSVSTPSTAGETVTQAETAILNAGLSVGQVTNASSNTVPSGDVISTSPTGGTSVAPGTPVSIVVSTGSTLTLQSIAVTPANPSIVVGTSQQFTATGTYSDNSTQNLTSSVTWSSSKTTVATVAASGKASGLAAGTTTISASMASPAVSGSTMLTVIPLGPCDANADGLYTIVDAQDIINQALGSSQPANDLNSDKVVNVVDLQIVINAVLKLNCTV